jgi:predicted nucleic acid-binding protein
VSIWIVNASPLILLGKIGRLGLLAGLADRLIIPAEVASEIAAGPTHDPARVWVASEGLGFIGSAVPADPRIIAWDLGAGETAVLSSGLLMSGALCLLDDRAARDCAAVYQLPVLGTAGVLVRAKRAGLLPAVRPELERLCSAGALLANHVVQDCLRLAGETVAGGK